MANSVKLKKALNIDDIYTSFKYQPLQIDDLDEFFVETDSARGGSPMRKRLARLLDREISDYQHILFVGYKGSGKSTELNQLQKDIQNNYLVVNYSVFR